jgi:hypothetical protein
MCRDDRKDGDQPYTAARAWEQSLSDKKSIWLSRGPLVPDALTGQTGFFQPQRLKRK